MKHPALRRLFYILLVSPFFKPGLFGVLEGTAWLERIYDIWRLAAAAIIVGLYLCRLLRRKIVPSKVLLWLGAYLFLVALSTVLHGRNYWFMANYMATIVCFCLLLELMLADDIMLTLDALFYPLTVLSITNFILEIIYPWGLCFGGTFGYLYNFLGIDNFMGAMLVPYMIVIALRSHLLRGDLDLLSYILIGIACLNLLLKWAVTGMMGMLVVLIFLLFFYQRRGQRLFNGLTAMGAGFGMLFGIVLLRLQNLFAFFIEDVLHKGLSFTGRTDIWDTAIRNILRSPYLGYGIAQAGKVFRLKKGKYYHAHNVFLEVTMEGGFCALICFLMMMATAAKPLMVNRKHPCACLISAGLMAAAVMTSMESFLDANGLMIYALVFMAYHVEKLIRCSDASPVTALEAEN